MNHIKLQSLPFLFLLFIMSSVALFNLRKWMHILGDLCTLLIFLLCEKDTGQRWPANALIFFRATKGGSKAYFSH